MNKTLLRLAALALAATVVPACHDIYGGGTGGGGGGYTPPSNDPPSPPASLAQVRSDGVTPLLLGELINESDVVLRARVSDPDRNTVRLHVEVQPVGTYFSGSSSTVSASVSSGGTAEVILTGLATGAYHWRARSVDSRGATSGWVSFGGNPEPDGVDFDIRIQTLGTSTNQAPAFPRRLGQFRVGTVHPVATGGTTPDSTLTIRGELSDPDGDPVKLEVEIQPSGTPFTGTAMADGDGVVTLFPPGPGTYHWQARAVDPSGAASPWVASADPAITIDPSLSAAPLDPTDLTQHDRVGTAAVASGYVNADCTMVMSGRVSDPDPGQAVIFEIEVQPLGTPFTDAATADSGPVANNTVADVPVSGLADGDYHWQGRTLDAAGIPSAWVAGSEFTVANPAGASPGTPAALAQFLSDGVTPLPSGAVTSEPRIVLKSSIVNAGGQPWHLEVEVRPIATPFTGTPTAVGAGHFVTVDGLADGSYHWQARAVDGACAVSPWVAFAGGVDFRVNTAANYSPGLSDAEFVRPDGALARFRGKIDAGEPGQLVRMRVEVQPTGTLFTGNPSATSPWSKSGEEVELAVDGLLLGTTYTWQAWAEDAAGAVSGMWAGTTFTRLPDDNVPDAPVPSQIHLSGVFAIPAGGTTNFRGALFSSPLKDGDGDTVFLQVEVQPAGIPFTDAPSVTGDARVFDLADLTGYQWQARTIDTNGTASAWASFGTTTDTDFRVDTSWVMPEDDEEKCGLLGGEVLLLFGLLALFRRRASSTMPSCTCGRCGVGR